jgi:hypothetical protein
MLSDWWNGVELWIAGLPFPFQFALVIVVLVPICLVVAWLIDRIVDHASAFFGPAEHPEPPLGGKVEEAVSDTAAEAGTAPAALAAEPVAEVAAEVAAEPVAEPVAEEQAPPRVPAESTGR